MNDRLSLSKELISDNGVIFSSIDDGELQNLIEVKNKIFNKENLLTIVSRVMKTGGNKGSFFSPNVEYVLPYAKNKAKLSYFREDLSDDLIKKVYNQIEKIGEKKGQKYRTMGLFQWSF
jgi:adenine-specific DNA-methyltransferase